MAVNSAEVLSHESVATSFGRNAQKDKRDVCSSECDKISSLPVFHVNEKLTHQVIYFYTKSSIFYVKVKIYTSIVLDCYQFPIF